LKHTLIFAVLTAGAVFGQTETAATGFSFRVNEGAPAKTVQGAPYTATITNESVQTLADGNRIVQTSTGTTARDSLGRFRQEALLPAIGGMSASENPRLVFITDPVAQTSYTLNLTEKTAHKSIGVSEGSLKQMAEMKTMAANVSLGGGMMTATLSSKALAEARAGGRSENAHSAREDLGTQIMKAVQVTGVRTTRTIPAGEIGNDNPINIVTEVWTSPDLKTIVYSKRSDPRTGVQIYKMTNISRTEPDPSMFTVPADFKVMENNEPGKVFFYKPNE
jgi:hypothetical protein